MGLVDILLLVFFLIFLIRGMIRGLVLEVIGILGIVLAFLCSFMIYTPMFKLMTAVGLSGASASIGAYVLGFLIVYIVVIFLGKALDKLISAIHLGWVNKILGGLAGIIKSAIIASIFLWVIIYALPLNSKPSESIRASTIGSKTLLIAPFIYEKINSISGVKRLIPFKNNEI